MATTLEIVTSDFIRLENVRSAGQSNGFAAYKADVGCKVHVRSTEGNLATYELGPNAKVTVFGNTVCIDTEEPLERTASTVPFSL